MEDNKVTERICGEEAEIVPAFMPGQWSEDNVEDDDSPPPSSPFAPDVDLTMNFGKHAPEQNRLSRPQMNFAVQKMKTSPRIDMPSDALALSDCLQSKSTDKTREGSAGQIRNRSRNFPCRPLRE